VNPVEQTSNVSVISRGLAIERIVTERRDAFGAGHARQEMVSGMKWVFTI